MLESYITHIKIIEDSVYPSEPPPPTASANTKKERAIIIAVRKSGRVRMHKARENGNGSFSIGKTWTLDEFIGVESFSGAVASSPAEEQRIQWAGGTGFIVTMGKPYYWQASTQKEKQFFIASLVKIYTKYTGGMKTPLLLGFDAREMEQLMGFSAPRQSPASVGAPPYGQNSQGRAQRRDPSREPALRKQPSREAMQRPPPQMSPSAASSLNSQTQRPQLRSKREESPVRSFDSNGTSLTQNLPVLRRPPGSNNQSQESFARSDDAGSLPPRSRGGLNSVPGTPGRFQDRVVTPTFPPTKQRPPPLNVPVTPEPEYPNARDIPNDLPAPLSIPPERRRPPLPALSDSSRGRRGVPDDIVPAPLASAGMRREGMQGRPVEVPPPSRGAESSLPSNLVPNPFMGPVGYDLDNSQQASQERPIEQNEIVSPNSENLPMIDPIPAPLSSPPAPESPEESRPGLGPMIKQKSKGDIASAFLRAAKNAQGASPSPTGFKPRAGGAAQRLRDFVSKSSEGPDGITSVVPAPSLVRGMSIDEAVVSPPLATPSITVDAPPAKSLWRKGNTDVIPEVSLSVALPDRPISFDDSVKDPEVIAAEVSKPREAKRPKPASEIMQKELTALGVDPGILNGRGNELVQAWDEFGWVGEGVHMKNIDRMKEEVERELNKVQAGGWLSRLEEEDERVEAIKGGLDKCMDECDELDGLLTLYLVELGVSHSGATCSSCR